MKRSVCCILIFLELFFLTGCKSADVKKVEKSINGIGLVSVEKEEKIISARSAFELLSEEDKAQVDNIADLAAAESRLRVCKAEQAIDQIGDISELTYGDRDLVAEAQSIYTELNMDEQEQVHNSDILDEAIAAIDSLAFDELENNTNIALMKGIIDGSFSGNQITYTLDRTNRNYIIEMTMNADASSAYFLYPAIAENLIKSIESNCEKICKDFYESVTKAYDVDCTFIMTDCYGGEIFTIVNGNPQ